MNGVRIRNHEVLRVPKGWEEQDRALVIQLNRILDDLYSRFENKYNAELKADKVAGAVAGNFAGLDSSGNLTDSGHKHSDYATKAEGVTNITRSGTTFTVTRADGTTFTFTQQDNDHYDWSDITNKPDTATRWPAWSEVTSKPDTATRWPAWSEVTSKPDTATRWPNWGEITQSGANNLGAGTGDITDGTELMTSYASNNGFSDSNAVGRVYRRQGVKIWNYIKGKTDPLYVDVAGDTMTGNLTMKGGQIAYQGTKATYNMIKFVDNTSDTYGNGISIGGGGLVVIGAGEASDTIASGKSGGDETLYLGSDGAAYLYTNVQNGLSSAKTFTFATDGTLTATKFSGPLTGDVTGNCSASNKLIGQTKITTVAELDAFHENGRMKFATMNGLSGLSGTLGNNDGMVIDVPWNDSWGQQIYVDDSSYQLHHRYKSNGTWQSWVQILDSNSYSSYAAKKTEAIKSISRSGTTFTATRCDDTTFTFTQQDSNTWRPVQDNLTSTSTSDCLSANQGRVLNDRMSFSSGSATRNTTNTSSGSCTYAKLRCGDHYIVSVSVDCYSVAGKSSDNSAIYFTGLPVPSSFARPLVLVLGPSTSFGNFSTLYVDASGYLRPWYSGTTKAGHVIGTFTYIA